MKIPQCLWFSYLNFETMLIRVLSKAAKRQNSLLLLPKVCRHEHFCKFILCLGSTKVIFQYFKNFLKSSQNCSRIYSVYTIALKHFLPQCVTYVSEKDRKRKQVMANHTWPSSLPSCIVKFLEHKIIYSTSVSSSVSQTIMLNKYGFHKLVCGTGNFVDTLSPNFPKLAIALSTLAQKTSKIFNLLVLLRPFHII